MGRGNPERGKSKSKEENICYVINCHHNKGIQKKIPWKQGYDKSNKSKKSRCTIKSYD